MNTELIPSYLTVEQRGITRLKARCNGAWSIAYTALWPEQQFPDNELKRTKALIRAYFDNTHSKRKAFIAFCERIILMKNYLKSKEGYQLPQPSVWFDPRYSQGFAASKKILDTVNIKRQEVPDYCRHYTIAATHYLQFVQKPCAKTFNSCRKKLLSFEAYLLLQHFCNSVLHFNYLNQ